MHSPTVINKIVFVLQKLTNSFKPRIKRFDLFWSGNPSGTLHTTPSIFMKSLASLILFFQSLQTDPISLAWDHFLSPGVFQSMLNFFDIYNLSNSRCCENIQYIQSEYNFQTIKRRIHTNTKWTSAKVLSNSLINEGTT